MKRQKYKSMGKITIQVLIPVIVILLGILCVMYQSMYEARQLVFRYIEDTAGLYVEQINTDIIKLNYEIITLVKKMDILEDIPSDIEPDDSRFYAVLDQIMEQNRNLKIRYKEPCCFYVYAEAAGLMILDSGTVFKSSQKTGVSQAILEDLEKKRGMDTPYSEWAFIRDEKQDYVYSRFSKNGRVMGCAIRLDTLFEALSIDSLGYEGVPYIIDEGKNIYISSKDEENMDKEDFLRQNGNMRGFFSGKRIYSFSITGIINENRSLHLLVIPKGGILEKIMRLQIILVILTISVILGSVLLVRLYYQRVLRPMRQFVKSLKNTGEEQWINENGKNNILELEMASKEFKGLLRKIKLLKIDIYEKELARQKTELEYMQVQIRPHFYLNCLSLIHSMADTAREYNIVHITEMLSNYMRYIMGDTFEPRPLGQEMDFIRSYVGIQQLRYGKDAFSFEVIMEEKLNEYLVPTLLIHTFVENAILHAVSLDTHVEITLYIVAEVYDDAEFLYICVSDTGKGFPADILKAIEMGTPIYYNNRKHIGIQNSIKRLRIMYGERALAAFSNMAPNYGAVAEIRIPAQKEVHKALH